MSRRLNGGSACDSPIGDWRIGPANCADDVCAIRLSDSEDVDCRMLASDFSDDVEEIRDGVAYLFASDFRDSVADFVPTNKPDGVWLF